jgi:hypothetical protein
MSIYTIHENNMVKLQEKFTRIAKKCSKYGCEFHYEEVGEEFRDVQHSKEVRGAYGVVENVRTGVSTERFIVIEAGGTAIINDWKFVATLEHTENGNIIRGCSGVELPEVYRTSAPKCDHCNSNRYRKDTYVIQNTVTGEFKQVGKGCLKDFTNGLSAEAVAQYLSYFSAIEELNDSCSLGGYSKRYVNAVSYLQAAVEIVNKCGFVSKQRAMDEETRSTSSIALSCLQPYSKADYEDIIKYDFKHDRTENIETVKLMLEWLSSQETTSQYISNLQIACKNEYVEYRDLGILASLPAAYFKAMETEKERLEREARRGLVKSNKFVGEVGDKLELSLTYVNRFCYETQYGLAYIHLFEDVEGNTFKWSTSNCLEKVVNGACVRREYGEVFTIKGTIKEHSIHGDTKQTILTRCKVLGN